jgi:hypothetical protein
MIYSEDVRSPEEIMWLINTHHRHEPLNIDSAVREQLTLHSTRNPQIACQHDSSFQAGVTKWAAYVLQTECQLILSPSRLRPVFVHIQFRHLHCTNQGCTPTDWLYEIFLTTRCTSGIKTFMLKNARPCNLTPQYKNEFIFQKLTKDQRPSFSSAIQ